MIVTSVNGYGWSREKTKKLGGLSFFTVCSRVAFRIVVILSSCVFFFLPFFLSSWWGDFLRFRLLPGSALKEGRGFWSREYKFSLIFKDFQPYRVGRIDNTSNGMTGVAITGYICDGARLISY